jgi:hypothetical protein
LTEFFNNKGGTIEIASSGMKRYKWKRLRFLEIVIEPILKRLQNVEILGRHLEIQWVITPFGNKNSYAQ